MKHVKKKINILSDNKEIILSEYISDINIKEEYFYKVSMEKYDNSEPCVIIKGKIANKLLCDLNVFINQLKNQNRNMISLDELPMNIKEAIEWQQEAEYIEFL